MWILYTVRGHDHEGYDLPEIVGMFPTEREAQAYADAHGLVYTERMYPKTRHVYDWTEVFIEKVEDLTKGGA